MTDNTSLFTAEMQRRRGKRRDLGTERLRDERLNDWLIEVAERGSMQPAEVEVSPKVR